MEHSITLIWLIKRSNYIFHAKVYDCCMYSSTIYGFWSRSN